MPSIKRPRQNEIYVIFGGCYLILLCWSIAIFHGMFSTIFPMSIFMGFLFVSVCVSASVCIPCAFLWLFLFVFLLGFILIWFVYFIVVVVVFLMSESNKKFGSW